jgi:hypothetical protein
MTQNEKRKAKILLLFIALICGVFLYFNLSDTLFGKKNEFDKVETENEKLIPLFNAQVAKEIEMYKSGWYSGCKNTAYMQVENLFTTIKEVFTYTRYGMASSQSHNRVLVQITYNDGRIVKDLYTDVSWNGKYLSGNPLLLKFIFEKGNLVRAFSNGVEKEGSPSETKNPLDHIVNAIIHQDYKDNESFYFLPDKTKSDYKKEWDKVK